MRYRLNLSVDEELYQSLGSIAKRYKFNGPCEMAVVLLRMFTKRVYRNELRGVEPPTVHEEVMDMFDECENYERTPANTLVPKQHRHTNK